MRKVLFLISHLFSGSSFLFDSLEQNPKIQGFRTNMIYDDPGKLLQLTKLKHKLNNRAAIYLEEVLFNHVITCKDLYNYCKFIYVIREPEPVLNALVGFKTYPANCAVRHYCYRLRRICEMAKRTPGAVFLTWEDLKLGRGDSLIENYLDLKETLKTNTDLFVTPPKRDNLLSFEQMQWASRCYEKHLYFLKQQNLIRS